MEYISSSEKETLEIAKRIMASVEPGDVLALYGNLGAGKTTLAKGIARVLGIKRTLTSPTFVLMKEYQTEVKPIRQLIHLDCYRLGHSKDAIDIGLLELFKSKSNLILIEWPEKIEDILPKKTKKIFLEYVNENTRKIKFDIK